jgi:hypothetical protein
MLYAIKEHAGDAFRVNVYGDEVDRNKHLVGYLADVDLKTLSFVTVPKISMASCFTLKEASLLSIKLNKLNSLKFYEIIEDTSHGL